VDREDLFVAILLAIVVAVIGVVTLQTAKNIASVDLSRVANSPLARDFAEIVAAPSRHESRMKSLREEEESVSMEAISSDISMFEMAMEVVLLEAELGPRGETISWPLE